MSKFGIAVPIVAIAALGACASEQPATPAPAPVVVVPQQAPAPVVTAPAAPTAVVVAPPVSIKPGYGRVETITALPTTAGAGTTAASDMRRLGVRMEDGTFQYVDAPAGSIKVGDRVQFTPEGYIRHPV
ncbi:MAG TPA: hypothetical protein VF110_10155 [Burkholderiales bacterium]